MDHDDIIRMDCSSESAMAGALTPIALLKHYMAEYPDSYLADQRYFDSYPEALRLRYGHDSQGAL